MKRGGLGIGIGVVAVAVVAIGVSVLLERSTAGERADDGRVVVVLDAGHGGSDPGAIHGGVEEADVNLDLLHYVIALIEADGRMRAIATRTTDVYLELKERTAVANDVDAELYLSIHCNASVAYPEAAGVLTLVSDTVTSGDASWQFAEILQGAVTSATGARDRGVCTQELYMHRATMPAALIEVGFLTNEAERVMLVDPAYQQVIAQGIYEGIVAYFTYIDPSF